MARTIENGPAKRGRAGRGRRASQAALALLLLIGSVVAGGVAGARQTSADSPAPAQPTCSMSVVGGPPNADPGTCSIGPAFQTNMGTTYTLTVTNTPITNVTWPIPDDPYGDTGSIGAFGSTIVDMTAPILIDPTNCMNAYGFVAIDNWNEIQTTNPGPYNCSMDIAGGSGTTVIKWQEDTTNFGYCVKASDGSGECTNGGPEFDISINWNPAPKTPTAAFTATQADPANNPGKYQFTDDSTDTDGGALTEAWDFGDGQSGTGASILHSYTKPGTYTATLKVTDASSGLSSTTTKAITVAAPNLQVGLDFVDAHGTPLSTVTPVVGDTVNVRLTVSASDDGVGSISAVAPPSGNTALSATPDSAVTIGTPTTPLPESFTLAKGQSLTATYPVTVNATGVVHFTSAFNGVDDSGNTVTGTPAQLSFGVSSMKVTLTANPPSFTEDQDSSGPKPTTVTVTETVTNITSDPLTNVNLNSFGPERSTTGQLLDVTQTSGPVPDPTTGYALADLAPGATDTLTATFAVKSNGKIAFDSLVTAASPDETTQRGYGATTIDVKPKYWLEFSSRVVTPNSGLLPAGSNIVIQGSIHNPSDTATDDVGPLFAATDGNAGIQGLSYDGTGVNPRAMQQPGDLKLDPGDTKDFTLKVATSYSDPTGAGGVQPSGGTSATIGFSPWATVTQADGTKFTTTDDQVLDDHGDEDVSHRISIDDSVPLPATASTSAIAGGLLAGGLQGVWNAASGMATGLVTLLNAPSATLYAVTEYQDDVWKHFTPAQRDAFAQSAADWIVPILEANATEAAKGSATLFQQASDFVKTYFTTLDNEWETGDYADVVNAYSNLAGNALAQVAIPAVIGKLATSSTAVDVVKAAQAADQASLAEATAGLSDTETMAQAAASLTKVAPGTELTPSLIQKMYGIAQNELAALQRLATENKFLLVVRSRAASSLDWLNDYSAMVKPEAIKIKSVSDLDLKLGYPAGTEGSLVFKEPVPLQQWKAGGGAYSSYVQSYVESRGFTPGTGEYYSAINRIAARTSEWNKYEATYKAWNERGWVDVSFNWKGNAMTDPTTGGSGKFVGFRLKPTGVDGEYKVQMLNGKVGKFVPVTGDIDPIAFTHIDGTPLTAEEHAKLVNEMRLDPNLQTQHGESATYVNGGVDFIESQFKPNEAALMIGPGDVAPRAVRFNAGASTWESATKYNLKWDGGFIDAGSQDAVPPTNVPVDQPAAATHAPSEPALPLPGDGTTTEPNVGRCSVTYSTAPSAPSVEMNPSGAIAQIVGTTLQASPLEQTCFAPGPIVNVQIQPSTMSSANITADTSEIPVDTGAPYAGDDPTSGFAVGQQVSIDPGTAQAETGTISGFGSIIFDHPLRNAHAAGAVLTVTGRGAAAPASVTNTARKTAGDQLPATGADTSDTADLALALLFAGLLAVGATRRRRSAEPVRRG